MSPRMCISWRIINVAGGVSAPGPRYKQGALQKDRARVKTGGFLRWRTTLSGKCWALGTVTDCTVGVVMRNRDKVKKIVSTVISSRTCRFRHSI